MTVTTLDKVFCIMRVVNSSNKPMTVERITVETQLQPRMIQRYAMRLASEGLIDFRNKPSGGRGFEYYRKGLRV